MAAATATARTADAGVRGGWWAWAWTPPPPPRLEEEEGGRVMRQKKEKWRRQKADGCTPSLRAPTLAAASHSVSVTRARRVLPPLRISALRTADCNGRGCDPPRCVGCER